MMDPLSYFSFQPVLYDWCNKGHGMCYVVCGMVHIKEPLLLIGKNNQCGSSGFPLSLSQWSLYHMSPTPYNRKLNVLSVSLNKTFPPFFLLMEQWVVRTIPLGKPVELFLVTVSTDVTKVVVYSVLFLTWYC